MINLLPTSERENLIYAKRNTKLIRIISLMTAAVFLMLLTWGAGYVYISGSINSYGNDVDQKREELKSQNLEETEKRIEEFSGSLRLIDQVLSKQVLFSELFRQIGVIMPPGTVLSSIEIIQVEGGIDLIAKARNYDSGTQVQVNLEDSKNKLFNKVDIVSISCNSTDVSYPCTVTLRALFTTENPFLLINQSSGEQR